MGISIGVHSSRVKSADGVEKCVPIQPLKRFPQHRKANPGDLIAEIKALPKKCYTVSEPEDCYWWIDGQFRPNDDSTLFVTSGCYTPRSTSAWITAKRIPAGRIVKYKLDSDTIKGETFSQSFTSAYPKIQMHPSGEYIGYIGVGTVTVETVQHGPVFEKHKDLRNCSFKHLAFAPNGKYVAVLLSASRRFEIFVGILDRGFANQGDSVDFSRLYKGFQGSRAYNEHLECKWSPDSSHIAVCTSIGYLVILDNTLKPVTNVFEDILTNDRCPSCAGAFDYDPRSCRQVLAFGTNDRQLFIVNTESRKVLYESEAVSKDPIDCMQYAARGDLMALSLRNWTVLLLETSSFETVFKLNIADSAAVTISNISGMFSAFPSVMRLSFSSTGEQIATSCCDGYVRVWQLPCVSLSLMELCRQTILSCVSTADIPNLPLPRKVLESLVSMPTML